MHGQAAQTGTEKPSLFAALRSDRRFAAMLGLGFASGIPYPLVYATQSYWLSEAGVALKTIGLMSWLTIAYQFKFLWAPFLEKYDPPLLARLGRRRGWIVWSQAVAMAALAGLAFGDPAHWLAWTVAFSLALGFAGATQDVVIDGWRITVVPLDKQPVMTSIAETGWRVGNFAAGAGAFYLAQGFGWRVSYLCMAAVLLLGAASAFFAPEPDVDKHASHDYPGFAATVFAPVKEMALRIGPMAIPILVMVAGFRLPGYLSNAMAIPLFEQLHYSKGEVATAVKLFGFPVALGGVALCSYVVARLGLRTGMLIGTAAASASHLSLAWLAAHQIQDFPLFALAVSIDGFAASFASVVLITYMSSLTSQELAGSQYALLTSLCALPGHLLAGLSGFWVERLGFQHFFEMTALIGLPVAALCWWVLRRHEPGAGQPDGVQAGSPAH